MAGIGGKLYFDPARPVEREILARWTERFELRRMIGEMEQVYRDPIERRSRRCPGPADV